jgi:hypothetical protein
VRQLSLNGTDLALFEPAMTPCPPALAAIAAALIALALSSLPAAAEDRVEMRFEGFGPAGLHVITTHTEIDENGTAYQIEGDVSTAGLTGVFVSVQNRSVARGRLNGGAAQPEIFDSETARNGHVQHNRVDYRAGGAPSGSSIPPPAEPVTPVDTTQLRGTVDNLTAYFLLERRLANGGDCALTVPVFDGRHRYNLRFSDAGDQVLAPVAGQNFAGAARSCHMMRDEIGGFYVDKSHQEGARAGTIWYARLLSGDLLIPVRMEMDTEIGKVEVYLAELRGRGVNRQFME